MNTRSLVTVYTSNGEKVSGVYNGTPDDLRRTFQQYKMHPKSKEFGVNLTKEDGGFIRVPINILNYSLVSVKPIGLVESHEGKE